MSASAERITFALAALGCRANQAELEGLRSALLARGAVEVDYPGPADILVVNTCAVTGSAQAQSRQEIRRAARIAGNGLLIATGCSAQLEPQALAGIAGVAHVAGNAAKSALPGLLDRLMETPAARRAGALPERVSWQADPTPARFLGRAGAVGGRRTRALLKIQDGCDAACSYCIVGRLRGRPLSRDEREVLDEARRLVEAGFREVVLTGVNLGLYGVEWTRGGERPQAATGTPTERSDPEGWRLDAGVHARLLALLRALARIEGLARLRLSSIEPMALSEALIEALAGEPRIAPSLHLPLQSGDDETLRRMGRPYRRADLRRLTARLTAGRGPFGLGADVIAGFPGESGEAFGRTLALLEELPLTYLHAFPFSARPGTPAAGMEGQVPPPVRRERVRRLRALDERLRLRFQERLRGRRCALLVERLSGAGAEGWSGEFVRLRGEAPGAVVGELIEVVAGPSLGPRLQACLVDRLAMRRDGKGREGREGRDASR